MSKKDEDEVTRDGFAYSYGTLYAQPGRVARVDGSLLRSMFLPKLTPKGRKQLRKSYSDYFVRGQLKHYGVLVDEGEICGYGTLFLMKVLQEGKCDKVPDNITEMRQQMHTEWLNKLSHEQISRFPDWVLEKYFLSSGQPDCTKTTTIIGIPHDVYSSYRVDKVRQAISKVAGLHQETGKGPKTHTVFLGWDSVAVSKAAKDHATNEAKEIQDAAEKKENERLKLHTDYLDALKRKKGLGGPISYSPVGSYIIRCEEIETQWPDQANDLILEICQSNESGIFEACFDFGILEGAMFISADKDALERYCARRDREPVADMDDGSSEEDDVEEEEDDVEEEDDDIEEEDDDIEEEEEETGVEEADVESENDNDNEEDENEVDDEGGVENDNEVEDSKKPTIGSKRKAEGDLHQGRSSKKLATQTCTYFLKLRCCETGEGDIAWEATDGTIGFSDETLATFTAEAELPWVAELVPFTARKKSDVPVRPMHTWDEHMY